MGVAGNGVLAFCTLSFVAELFQELKDNAIITSSDHSVKEKKQSLESLEYIRTHQKQIDSPV